MGKSVKDPPNRPAGVQYYIHTRNIRVFTLFFIFMLYLCKRPRCDSHSRVMVSPIFCNISAFSFYFTCPHTRFSDFLSFFGLSVICLPSQTWFLALFSVLNHTSLLSHFTLKFQTKLDVIFKLSFFIQTSSMSVYVSMMFNLKQLTKEPHTCHHEKPELRSCLLTACLPTESQF